MVVICSKQTSIEVIKVKKKCNRRFHENFGTIVTQKHKPSTIVCSKIVSNSQIEVSQSSKTAPTTTALELNLITFA